MALKRQVGPFTVFAVAAGAMISSGLFVLPVVIFRIVGPGVTACYLLAGIFLLPALVTKAELMTAIPHAGGVYFFIDRSLGPAFGMMGGLAAWASIAFKSAFALLGIGMLGSYVFKWDIGGWQVKALASLFCVGFGALNYLGVKEAGRAQIVLVGGLLLVLFAYIVSGMGQVTPAPLGDYLRGRDEGIAAVLRGAGMVFISFGGLAAVTNLGQEVQRPRRDLLLGMFAATGLVLLLYVLTVFITSGLLPADPNQWQAAPISQAADTLWWGRTGGYLLGFAAMAAFMTTGNAGIMSASRTMMAMSRDELLPEHLGRVSKRRGTPDQAILATTGFMLAVILLLELDLFVKVASAMMIMMFLLEMLSLIVLHESHIPTYQPTWRCPGYPWIQVGGIVLYVFLLVELGTLPLALAAAVLGSGLVWYVVSSRVSVLRESALYRLGERLAAADFEGHDIEAELAQVARERDQVYEDRFDQIIKECTVIDLSEPVTREELFRMVAQELAEGTDVPHEEVYSLLEKREQLSSTVVRPGLAIPHIIDDRFGDFQVLLVRHSEGVQFEESDEPVRCIFAVAAPPEERNFYLKSLVAVAEIAQVPEFDEEWLNARGAEALREVVLRAERRRE